MENTNSLELPEMLTLLDFANIYHEQMGGPDGLLCALLDGAGQELCDRSGNFGLLQDATRLKLADSQNSEYASFSLPEKYLAFLVPEIALTLLGRDSMLRGNMDNEGIFILGLKDNAGNIVRHIEMICAAREFFSYLPHTYC